MPCCCIAPPEGTSTYRNCIGNEARGARVSISKAKAVAAAAVAGFIGNEWVARYHIRTGRKIGSAALVADGLRPLTHHAR